MPQEVIPHALSLFKREDKELRFLALATQVETMMLFCYGGQMDLRKRYKPMFCDQRERSKSRE
jgi:hypothetical protein